MNTNKKHALFMDTKDALKAYRKEFFGSEKVIYFDGNSLGLLSKRAETALEILNDHLLKQVDLDINVGD